MHSFLRGSIRPLISVVALLAISPAFAAPPNAELKGISRVWLLCSVDKPLKDAGLDEKSIELPVEVRMRNIGIKVVADNGATAGQLRTIVRDPHSVMVAISVTGVKIPADPAYCYTVTISVYEQASVSRIPNARILVSSWQHYVLGCVGASDLTSIKETAGKIADTFCNDYLIANPKPFPVAR